MNNFSDFKARSITSIILLCFVILWFYVSWWHQALFLASITALFGLEVINLARRINFIETIFLYTYAFITISCVWYVWYKHPYYKEFFAFLIGCSSIHDICAYFIGKFYGKIKLAPSISPKKTLEGALGGLFGMYCFLYFWNMLSLHKFHTISLFTSACTLSCIAIAGDLYESWIKRQAGVKDSGTFLPGHGGIFDRIDSMLALTLAVFILSRGFNF